MTYFDFPNIEEDDYLKNLRNDVKSFLQTTFNSNNIKPQADAWMYSANPDFSKKLVKKDGLECHSLKNMAVVKKQCWKDTLLLKNF